MRLYSTLSANRYAHVPVQFVDALKKLLINLTAKHLANMFFQRLF